jgi:hypothetical protein
MDLDQSGLNMDWVWLEVPTNGGSVQAYFLKKPSDFAMDFAFPFLAKLYIAFMGLGGVMVILKR